MNGKGDKRRPSQVSDKELADRWNAAFGSKSNDKPQSGNHQSRGLDGKAKQV